MSECDCSCSPPCEEFRPKVAEFRNRLAGQAALLEAGLIVLLELDAVREEEQS
jgi:hypothetical protein